MDRREKLQQWQKRLQQRLVVWIVLTICFQVLTMILGWPFLEYVAWLAAFYCLILLLLWGYFAWQLWKN